MPDRIKSFRFSKPKQRERKTPSDAEAWRFYNSARWQRLRSIKLGTHPLCQDCEAEGKLTAAVDVDHVQDRREHPDLAYDLDNLRSLCKSHHGRKTMRRNKEQGKC